MLQDPGLTEQDVLQPGLVPVKLTGKSSDVHIIDVHSHMVRRCSVVRAVVLALKTN